MTRRHVAFAAAAIAAALIASATHAAALGTTSVQSVPLTLTASVPCANGGLGESVQLTGSLHIVATTTFDAAGGIHLYSHFSPQDVSGTGLVSGASYRGTGVTASQLNLFPGIQQIVVNNFQLVGTTGAPSLRVHEILVFVVDANGKVTVAFDDLRLTCA